MQETIFRENDIRGTYPEEINELVMKDIAIGIAKKCKSEGVDSIAVARDGRLSGEPLLTNFCEAILNCGINVNCIGLATSPMLYFAAKKENFDSTNPREAEIESFLSGLGLAKRFNKLYGKNLKTNEIFELNRKHDLDAERFIDDFKVNLAMSLSSIINILDPDAFVFGGGVSNEIDFLHEIDSLVRKFVIGREYEGVFLKPRYGDASGVRGAARLGRSTTY